jgi:hypothetical protein
MIAHFLDSVREDISDFNFTFIFSQPTRTPETSVFYSILASVVRHRSAIRLLLGQLGVDRRRLQIGSLA